MTDLSSEARALLGEGRGMLRPSLADRARVASRLAGRLGAVPLGAHRHAEPTPRSAPSRLTSAIAALALLGAPAAYILTRAPAVPVAAPAPARAATTPVAQPTAIGQPCVAPPQPVVHAAVSRPTPARRARTSDGLADEVALLSRATSELSSGNAAAALLQLDEHARRFPVGRLIEERRSARVQALCALGERREAGLELARLATEAPTSPHVPRVHSACGL